MVHVQMYQCEKRPSDWPFSKLFECDRYKIEYGKMFIEKKEGEKIGDKGGGEGGKEAREEGR